MSVSSPRREAARRWSLGGDRDVFYERQLAEARERITNLERALTNSRTIGTAIGIVMERRKVSTEQAFTILARASQHSNRKLADLAADIAYTGQLPEESTGMK